MKHYWLVKSEPDAYSWNDLVKEKKTSWTGVRNFKARNNLRSMRVGDEVLFYHSVTDKAVVGIAKVVRVAYPDRTAKEGDWSTVDLAPVSAWTERRDWRTREMFFNGRLALIWSKVTGWRSGLIGARSTVLQSPSFAVGSEYAARTTLVTPTTALSVTL